MLVTPLPAAPESASCTATSRVVTRAGGGVEVITKLIGPASVALPTWRWRLSAGDGWVSSSSTMTVAALLGASATS